MRRVVRADFLHHPRIVLLGLRSQLVYLLGCDLGGLRRRDLGRCGIALAEHLGERAAPQARKGAGRHGREQVFQHAGPLLGIGSAEHLGNELLKRRRAIRPERLRYATTNRFGGRVSGYLVKMCRHGLRIVRSARVGIMLKNIHQAHTSLQFGVTRISLFRKLSWARIF